MLINLISKVIIGLTAIALIVYAITPNATLGYLAKLFALNWGMALVVFLAWPHVRGVKKGDLIFVSEESSLPLLFALPNATSKDSGRLNGFIRVEFGDRTTGIGKIIKYQGLITHAEVKLFEKDIPMKVTN
jgi:hypothetical protein